MQPLWPQGCLLPAENATLALNHRTHSCHASLWEGFPHNMKPVPSLWGCGCADPGAGGGRFPSSITPPKVREYALLLLCQLSPCGKRAQLGAALPANTRCTIWIHESVPSLSGAWQSEALRCDQEGQKTPERSNAQIHTHAYERPQLIIALPVSRPQETDSTQPPPKN